MKDRPHKFHKSTYSDDGTGCVEVDETTDPNDIAVRDSKLADASPVLYFTGQAWSDFIRAVRGGEFDLPA